MCGTVLCGTNITNKEASCLPRRWICHLVITQLCCLSISLSQVRNKTFEDFVGGFVMEHSRRLVQQKMKPRSTRLDVLAFAWSSTTKDTNPGVIPYGVTNWWPVLGPKMKSSDDYVYVGSGSESNSNLHWTYSRTGSQRNIWRGIHILCGVASVIDVVFCDFTFDQSYASVAI